MFYGTIQSAKEESNILKSFEIPDSGRGNPHALINWIPLVKLTFYQVRQSVEADARSMQEGEIAT